MENKILKEILEWSFCIVLALILALLIRYYIVTPTVVKQESMYSTLEEGQRIILSRVNRISKKEYSRGQIVTFEAPSKNTGEKNLENPVAVYDYEPQKLIEKLKYNVLELNKKSYIKRVIGIAGDKIQIKDGNIYINGAKLQESYLKEGTFTSAGYYNDMVVPEGYIYVMGDNRSESMDSRSFGCIPIEKIEGVVIFRYWPFSEFGKIKNEQN